MAHLYTGKNLGLIAGIAWGIGVVCNQSNSYALSVERPRMEQTVAHELGHLIGGTHPPDVQCNASRTIMCQGDFKIMEFSPFSINEITDYVSNNSSCLAHYAGSISILGPNTLCASDAFEYRFHTFSNISWSVAPASLFSSPTSGNGPIANLTRASPTISGDAILTYTIEGECDDFQVSRSIRVGPPNDALIVTASHWGPPIVREIDASTTTFAEANYNVANPGQTHFIEEYEWEIWDTHSNWSIIPQHGGGPPFNAHVEIQLWHIPLPSQQTIYVRVRNACGWSLWQETFWDVIGGCSFCAFTVYPNPAAEEIRIRLENEEGKVAGENTLTNTPSYMVRIYRDDGGLVWEKETTKQEEIIPTASWREGIYHVRIHHPEGEFSQKVIVRH